MKRIPKRLWTVCDPASPGDDAVLAWFATRREARERCARFNSIAGYEPTCIVARYDLPKESEGK